DMAIHKFTDLIYHKKPIQMFGDGSSQRDYTFVSDIVHGIIQSMDRCSGYNIYNLGESNTISLKELISLIEDSIDTKAIIEPKPFQPGDVPITYADVTKARKELDYNPQVNIEEGIKRFAVWYLNRKQNKV
ncbi:GDP-mannose 4,6-dehydratase, partial [bacterium]|nr:GDP-mannose 4,6-dehydratase [bacterium]